MWDKYAFLRPPTALSTQDHKSFCFFNNCKHFNEIFGEFYGFSLCYSSDYSIELKLLLWCYYRTLNVALFCLFVYLLLDCFRTDHVWKSERNGQ